MSEFITLTLNGMERRFEADPEKPLLWALREDLATQSAKYSCGIGICGACLVFVDDALLASCVTPLKEAEGKSVTTLEGLNGAVFDAVKAAWIAEDVPQCGYCQSGQITAATELLLKNPKPTDQEISEAMSRVLCRCGTYPAIRRAIRRASAEI